MQPILVQPEQGRSCPCDIIIMYMLTERTIHIFVRSLFSEVLISIFNSFRKTAGSFSSLKVLGYGRGITRLNGILGYLFSLK